jgi:transcription initiation factor TFIIB
MICPECGLVVGDRVIDVGSEWRTFSNDSGSTDRSRVGGTEDPLMGGNELTTFIDSKQVVYGIGNKETQNFTKWQKSGNSGDRGLVSAFAEIGVMANRIHLPKSIVDRSKELFKQVHEEKTLKGRANDAIASACLYIACRQDGVPRSFKEICAVSKYSKKEIGRCFKLIHKAMKSEMAVVDSKDFMVCHVQYFSYKLHLLHPYL